MKDHTQLNQLLLEADKVMQRCADVPNLMTMIRTVFARKLEDAMGFAGGKERRRVRECESARVGRRVCARVQGCKGARAVQGTSPHHISSYLIISHRILPHLSAQI